MVLGIDWRFKFEEISTIFVMLILEFSVIFACSDHRVKIINFA